MAALELFSTTLFFDPNLQGYYRYESNWNDSKNSNNLTAANSPTFVSGKFNNAGSFASASSQYADITAFEYTTNFTWLCWFNRTSGTDGAIISKSKTDASVLRRLYVNSDQTITFQVDGLTGSTAITAATSTGTTYFLAGVYDSTNGKLKVWLNTTKTETNCSGSPTASNGNWTIGRDAGIGNAFNGWIDDTAVFNRALTDTEIQGIYNGVFGLSMLGGEI